MTEVYYLGKKVVKIELKPLGEDPAYPDYLWAELTFEDGTKLQTPYFKTVIA